MNFRTVLLLAIGLTLTCAVAGCGSAASTKAPPITGKPRVAWKDMTTDQKIESLQHSPAPNKAQLIEQVKQGKY